MTQLLKKYFISGLILVIGTLSLTSCKTKVSPKPVTPITNSKEALKKPYLILVSLDGFRWDYVSKYKPPHLSNFIKTGVKATSLIPSFPSKTFPNHYTIATGMYPDKNGIVGNSFYSYRNKAFYSIGKRETVEDGSFYGGSPIWVQADKAGMVTASYFFVGSEADIQGLRPTYYYRYDGKVKNKIRVTQALKWLSLPAEKRPHLITMYFSDMDDVGHRFGPDNDGEIKKTLFDLDKQLGDLFNGTKATGLAVNIIVVSDHGMATQLSSNYIPIESIKNDSLFLTINNGAIVNIHPTKGIETNTVIKYLKQKEQHFKVYKTGNTPGFEYKPKNKDWGALQIIPDYGYYFLTRKQIETKQKLTNKTFGSHGYNPTYKDMQGIFYAKGPAFKKGYVASSVKNIHIYPLMCQILGLEIPDNIDGKLAELKAVLKNN
jgi:predicted AlkP superfamily pyrophosphatase or phosphodiesterase